MAKTMVLLDNNTIVNLLWCSDAEPETDVLKNLGDYSLRIGDTFADGRWYRDGVALFTPLEEAEMKNKEYLDSIAKLIEEVFQSDIEITES